MQTDNGWYHIRDVKPSNNEEVIVILERESSAGVSYTFSICSSAYKGGVFLAENEFWHVRYWRRKEDYPYPSDVAKKSIEECKKYSINPINIINHQKKFGIDIK